MSKQAVFTMKLEEELRDEFMAAAAAAHRPASQVARELMREFVRSQRDAQEYESFLAGRVRSARESIRAGESLTNDEVEAEFVRRRTAAR